MGLCQRRAPPVAVRMRIAPPARHASGAQPKAASSQGAAWTSSPNSEVHPAASPRPIHPTAHKHATMHAHQTQQRYNCWPCKACSNLLRTRRFFASRILAPIILAHATVSPRVESIERRAGVVSFERVLEKTRILENQNLQQAAGA